jgi:hypothetical protein
VYFAQYLVVSPVLCLARLVIVVDVYGVAGADCDARLRGMPSTMQHLLVHLCVRGGGGTRVACGRRACVRASVRACVRVRAQELVSFFIVLVGLLIVSVGLFIVLDAGVPSELTC